MLLGVHIFSTMVSLLLGYYLFGYQGKLSLEKRGNTILLNLCFFLMCGALSGIFLNLYHFSPFHILSIITLTTIPRVCYKMYKKSDILGAFRGAFFNFLGLNITFIGVFFPSRNLGYRFWGMFGHPQFAVTVMQILLCIGIYVAIYFIYHVIHTQSFFPKTNNV